MAVTARRRCYTRTALALPVWQCNSLLSLSPGPEEKSQALSQVEAQSLIVVDSDSSDELDPLSDVDRRRRRGV